MTRSLGFGLWLVLSAAGLHAAHLPIRVYTTADGLPSNNIVKIVPDSHGFIWFSTDEGLSRFDGYTFVNYRTEQGLPSNDVRDLLETRSGQYWVATSRGVCRFHPGKDSKFQIYRLGEKEDSNNIQTLYEDRAGTIWAGTWSGLYRLRPDNTGFDSVDSGPTVYAILEDRHGDLWVGALGKLSRRLRDGRIERYTIRSGFPPEPGTGSSWVTRLLEDREGHLWVGTRGGGLSRLVREPRVNEPIVDRIYTNREGLGVGPGLRIRAVLQARDGTLWLATNSGLAKLLSPPGVDPVRFQTYTTANGLSELELMAAAEDREGNIWVGCANAGAMKIARNGFTTFDAADGVGLDRPTEIFEDRAGQLLVLTTNQPHTTLALNRFDGHGFHALRPKFGGAIRNFGWQRFQVALQDGTGDWWFGTENGLCRFPNVPVARLPQIRPKAIYTSRDGVPGDDVYNVFEDSRGDIWVQGVADLSRWSRATGSFHHYSISELPRYQGAAHFAQDLTGNVWMARLTQLVRYREGQFTRMTSGGSPRGGIDSLYADRAGRIWFGDETGLTRIDDPGADHPRFVHYGTAEGLSGSLVSCITEDQWGRIYLGSVRGVDRLDPTTGGVKHYSMADGLVKGEVYLAYRDKRGALWFGTWYGISRFVPEPASDPSTAEVRVSGLRIRGVSHAISDLGETAVSGLTLAHNQNQVQIDFDGLGFNAGDLRYQYMLEGADHTWNQPTDQRTVNYANLSPGSYRFLVRAVTTADIAFKPAVVDFEILRPLWLRWWAIALEALATALAIYIIYRYHLGRALELARIRMRIATDLHDDIGASLTQVALLSEVVGQKIEGDAQVRAPLQQVGDISRQLVDSMSDIVWSINPNRETLGDLVQRMRAFASDVFPARDIAFRFHAPDAGQDLKLGVEARRQVFLIFKESAKNIVRHSGCSEAEIDFRIEGDWLALRLSDNGKGFEPLRESTGHGLISMRERARTLGGEFQVSSGERGTTVTLRIPASGPRPTWRKRFLLQ